MLTRLSLGLPAKAFCSIWVRLSGRVRVLRSLPSKALSPMVAMVLGIITSTMSLSLKALSSMPTTDLPSMSEGISMLVDLPLYSVMPTPPATSLLRISLSVTSFAGGSDALLLVVVVSTCLQPTRATISSAINSLVKIKTFFISFSVFLCDFVPARHDTLWVACLLK